jgi:hypothetical protein
VKAHPASAERVQALVSRLARSVPTEVCAPEIADALAGGGAAFRSSPGLGADCQMPDDQAEQTGQS